MEIQIEQPMTPELKCEIVATCLCKWLVNMIGVIKDPILHDTMSKAGYTIIYKNKNSSHESVLGNGPIKINLTN